MYAASSWPCDSILLIVTSKNTSAKVGMKSCRYAIENALCICTCIWLYMFELTTPNVGWWMIVISNWLLVSFPFIVIHTSFFFQFLYQLVCLLFIENYSNYSYIYYLQTYQVIKGVCDTGAYPFTWMLSLRKLPYTTDSCLDTDLL